MKKQKQTEGHRKKGNQRKKERKTALYLGFLGACHFCAGHVTSPLTIEKQKQQVVIFVDYLVAANICDNSLWNLCIARKCKNGGLQRMSQ